MSIELACEACNHRIRHQLEADPTDLRLVCPNCGHLEIIPAAQLEAGRRAALDVFAQLRAAERSTTRRRQ